MTARPAPALPSVRRGSLRRQEALAGYAFALPYTLGILVLVIVPLLAVVALSFTDWSLLGTPAAAGAKNYLRLLHDPQVRASLGVTALFTAGILLLNISLALALAGLMNLPLRGVTAFRTVVFSPVVMPVVAWALVWKFLLQPQGPVNGGLHALGFPDANLLLAPATALWTLVGIEVIKAVGLNAVIFLAALQGVPKEVTEAARLDGAGPWASFTRITLPLISPTFFLVFLVTLIGALKVFTPIWVLTGGGPANRTTTLLVQMYKQGFTYFDFGYASAIAAVLFALVLALTLAQWSLRRRLVFYER